MQSPLIHLCRPQLRTSNFSPSKQRSSPLPAQSGKVCDSFLTLRSSLRMFGRFRVLVSVSAAFPISSTDGEVVYNFRGSLDTANFLGQLFRTLSEVLNLTSSNNEGTFYSYSLSILPPFFDIPLNFSQFFKVFCKKNVSIGLNSKLSK